VTREVVWTGYDRAFVEAMIAELGILLDVESATVSIIRMHSVQMYTIDDGAIEISLTAGPNRIEVRRTVIGIRGETVVNLSEVRANRARLQCHALVDRIQVRELNATPAGDDPGSGPPGRPPSPWHVPHSCPLCHDGWVCEQHPDRGWPHDDCGGPGKSCPVLEAEQRLPRES
jgi:hypothetical protein